MKKDDFLKIKNLNDLQINSNNLKVGDKFLFGEKMCNQSEKNINDSISYYEVIDIKENGNILYILKIDKLGE